jgi:putative ABC transport system permease protein
MLKNYVKVAWRNLTKQKGLSFINVFGLAVGISCFCLFLLYAVNEFSYDRFHENADRIFRVNQVWKNSDGSVQGMAGLNMPLGPALKNDFPDVENFVRFNTNDQDVIKANNKILRLKVCFADPQVFSVFSFKLLRGSAADALKDPHSIVLTKSTALTLFGNLDCIGQRAAIKVYGKFEPFTVNAIADDVPANSSIQFAVMGCFDFLAASPVRTSGLHDWNATFGDETYVELKPGSNLNKDAARLLSFRLKYYPDEAEKYKKTKTTSGTFELRPLVLTHLSPDIDSGPPGSSTDPKNIWLLIGIASGILLIACINFTTLAIGRSAGRAKEVGMRKVMGGMRKQLACQFLTESLMLSIFSGGIGLFLANLLLPYFSQFCGKDLTFSFSQFPELTWLLAGLILLVGLLGGIYPALVLSGFNPVAVLKSKVKLGGGNFFTKSLVTFQFAISVVLIISTIIIFQQMHFIRSKNIGFNKENVITIQTDDANPQKIYPLFRQAVKSHPEINGIACSEFGLGEGQGEMSDNYSYKGKGLFSIVYPVDQDYLNVMGMHLVAGRNFDRAITTDTANSIIANETFVKNNLGITALQAIGMQLKEGDDKTGKTVTIIGVVRDFNFEPLSALVRPQVFNMPGNLQPNKFFVRIQAGDPAIALNVLKKTWANLVPGLEFKYSFLDEDFDRFYKSEEKWSQIAGWAGGISILLACLGLFGLSALAIVNRTGEIAIRKVLGAPVASIAAMLSKDFLKLVTIALFIAAPVAWYFMNKWLQGYAYRIHIEWWAFALPGAAVIITAALTVSFQVIKTVLTNPVKSLKIE